jgi:hypothetical protein
LKQQLAEAEAKAAEAGIEDVKLDESEYEAGDVKIVRAINILKKQVEAKDTKIKNLEKKASDYEADIARDKAEQAKNSRYNELLAELDEEYGAEHRNAAVKLFNEKADKGEVPKGSPAKATLIMNRCYKEAKAEADKANKDKDKDKTPALDTGSGGGTAPSLSGVQLKEGSLDEVAEQAAAATRTG